MKSTNLAGNISQEIFNSAINIVILQSLVILQTEKRTSRTNTSYYSLQHNNLYSVHSKQQQLVTCTYKYKSVLLQYDTALFVAHKSFLLNQPIFQWLRYKILGKVKSSESELCTYPTFYSKTVCRPDSHHINENKWHYKNDACFD